MTTAIRAIPAIRVPAGKAMVFIFGYLHGAPWYEPRYGVWCCRTQAGQRTRYYRKLYAMKDGNVY